ncbi:MAG: hypothetical protein ACRCY3_16075 [Sphingorhabdus sp.]
MAKYSHKLKPGRRDKGRFTFWANWIGLLSISLLLCGGLFVLLCQILRRDHLISPLDPFFLYSMWGLGIISGLGAGWRLYLNGSLLYRILGWSIVIPISMLWGFMLFDAAALRMVAIRAAFESQKVSRERYPIVGIKGAWRGDPPYANIQPFLNGPTAEIELSETDYKRLYDNWRSKRHCIIVSEYSSEHKVKRVIMSVYAADEWPELVMFCAQ